MKSKMKDRLLGTLLATMTLSLIFGLAACGASKPTTSASTNTVSSQAATASPDTGRLPG